MTRKSRPFGRRSDRCSIAYVAPLAIVTLAAAPSAPAVVRCVTGGRVLWRQVEDLEEKQTKGDEMDAGQLEKIQKKPEVQREMATLSALLGAVDLE